MDISKKVSKALLKSRNAKLISNLKVGTKRISIKIDTLVVFNVSYFCAIKFFKFSFFSSTSQLYHLQ